MTNEQLTILLAALPPTLAALGAFFRLADTRDLLRAEIQSVRTEVNSVRTEVQAVRTEMDLRFRVLLEKVEDIDSRVTRIEESGRH